MIQVILSEPHVLKNYILKILDFWEKMDSSRVNFPGPKAHKWRLSSEHRSPRFLLIKFLQNFHLGQEYK